MRYAFLVYESPETFARRQNGVNDPYIAAWRAYYRAMQHAGVYVAGDALEVPETAATVRIAQGQRHVQDGPYADTKEQLAGVMVLELPSFDAALEWAARCPAAAEGAMEVRALSFASKEQVVS
jgi:hypothetical protein